MSTEYPIHIGPVFPCAYCLTAFINTDFLFKHIRKCHAGKHDLLFKDNLLPKDLAGSDPDVERKESTEHSEEKSSASKSSSTTSDKEKLNIAIEDSSPGSLNILTELLCTICNSRFADNYELRKHMNTHIVDSSTELHTMNHSKFSCKVCQKLCATKASFNKHIKYHIGMYVCKFCPKIYSHLNNFLMHLESHSDIDQTDQIIQTINYTCRCCYEEFDDAHEMICHLKLEHSKSEEKIVKCMICNLEYESFGKFQRHLKFHLKFTNVNEIQEFLEKNKQKCGNEKEKLANVGEREIKKRKCKNFRESDVTPVVKIPNTNKSNCDDDVTPVVEIPDTNKSNCDDDVTPVVEIPDTNKSNCEENDVTSVVKIPNTNKSNCEENDVTPVVKIPDTNKSNCEENDVTPVVKIPDTNKSNCEENDVTPVVKIPDTNKSNCEENDVTPVVKIPDTNKSNCEENDVTPVVKITDKNKSNCEENDVTPVIEIPDTDESNCEENDVTPVAKIPNTNKSNCEENDVLSVVKVIKVNCKQCNRAFRNNDLYQAHLDNCANEPIETMTNVEITNVETITLPSTLPPLILEQKQIILPILEQKSTNINTNTSTHCQICGRNFPHINLFNKHFLLFHDVNTSFHCRKCNERFLTKLKYFHHIKTKHKNPISTFKCRVCHKEFLHMQALRQHMFQHKNPYGKKENPESHIILPKSGGEVILPSYRPQVSTSAKKYECKTCHRCFLNRFIYARHMSSHKTQKQQATTAGANHVSCTICQKEFPSLKSLTGHMSAHKKSDRLMHYKYKTKPAGADKKVQVARLNVEKKTNSTDEIPIINSHTCPYCAKSFPANFFLLGHIGTHKNEGHESYNDVIEQLFCSYKETNIPTTREADDTKRDVASTKPSVIQKKFSCSYCNQKFVRKSGLISHERMHKKQQRNLKMRVSKALSFSPTAVVKEHTTSNPELIKCVFCLKRFKTKFGLFGHFKQHKHEKTYRHMRGKLVTSLTISSSPAIEQNNTTNSTKVDQNTDDKGRKLKCKFCPEIFTRNAKLLEHLIVHKFADEETLYQELYKAPATATATATSEQLNNTITAEEDQDMTCNICNRNFLRQGDLTRHLRHTHCDGFDCSQCILKFPTRAKLTEHLITHQKAEMIEYSCTMCVDKFTERLKYDDHVLLHAENRLHICTLCKRSFGRLMDLKKHKTSVHADGLFECTICKEEFTMQSQLEAHLLLHNPCFRCNLCKREFSFENELKKHKADLHDIYECELCKEIFLEKDCFMDHMLAHSMMGQYKREKKSSNRGEADKKCETVTKPPKQKVEMLRGKLQLRKVDETVTKQSNIKGNPNPEIVRTVLNKNKQDPTAVTLQKPKHPETPPVSSGKDKKMTMCMCNLCKTQFQTRRDLVQHKDRFHDIYECEVCSLQFLERATHDEHFATHQTKSFNCDICNEKFLRLTDLKIHRSLHLKRGKSTATATSSVVIQKINCEICEVEFATEAELIRHNHSHFECSICKATFDNQFLLTEHRLTHSTFQCEICSWEFTIEEDFIKHKQNHVERCETCGEEFTDMVKFNQHVESHAKFRCTVCTQLFYDENELINHKAIDHDIHECDICKKQFDVKDELESHMVSHLDNLYTCNICPETFFTRSEFTRHKQTHMEEFQCIICKVKLPTRNIYYQHLLVHKNEHVHNLQQLKHTEPGGWIVPEVDPEEEIETIDDDAPVMSSVKKYPCDLCFRQFSSVGNMKRHMNFCKGPNEKKGKAKKENVCPVCNLYYSKLGFLRQHYERYRNDAQHQVILSHNINNECLICNIKFYNQEQFREHYERCHC